MMGEIFGRSFNRKLTPFALLLVMVFPGESQQADAPEMIIDSSTVGIITRVPFNGTDYFIAIAPLDSTNIDNMPIVSPFPMRRRGVLLIDSLARMFQDSLIRKSPRQEDFSKPQQPGR